MSVDDIDLDTFALIRFDSPDVIFLGNGHAAHVRRVA